MDKRQIKNETELQDKSFSVSRIAPHFDILKQYVATLFCIVPLSKAVAKLGKVAQDFSD